MAEYHVAEPELPDLKDPFILSAGKHTIIIALEPAIPPAFFEILLADEFGVPIDQPVEVVIATANTNDTVLTDSCGIAKVENVSGVHDAELSFTQNSITHLESVLGIRWKQFPRMTGRENDKIKKSDKNTVVHLRSTLIDQKIPIVSGIQKKISIQQPVVMARMKGLYFDTMKCFLLPEAIEPLRLINNIYKDNSDSKLLIIGHTDTSGKQTYNDQLSIDRAESVAAYLTDNIDAWIPWYDESIDDGRRWGKHENNQMLDTVLSEQNLPGNADKVKEFQKLHNAKLISEGGAEGPLAEDGVLGNETRRALIMRYMKQDNTSLPAGIEPIIHGCGEHFPLDDSEKELDTDPKNSAHDQADRRVELFFFSNPVGILPEPTGKNSAKGSIEYPEWRSRSRKIEVGDDRGSLTIRFIDGNGQPMPIGTPYRVTVGNTVREGTLTESGVAVFYGMLLEGEDTAFVEWGEASKCTYTNPQ
ncbi:OmpA family protein [bacterium]|nr:OmpA family protein [candidate division CSSED10-310 bacterium]